ncbi:MAG: hypothetical protein NC548_30335 [Lachnospiraceae bacterium]|nr:hypothetical protein [Lachnospiraceae bacterium]
MNCNTIYKRYRFVDHNGNQRGIENVDDLNEAIQIAIDYQCEVIDTKATQSPVVYSVWDGWNTDYDFYAE